MPLDPTRINRITASMVPAICAGNAAKLQNYFLRIIGDPRYQDDGFADSWLSRYGLAVEPLALDWHAEKTGFAITKRAVQLFHPQRPYVSCTLDGYRAHDNTVIDCKAINAHRDIDEALAYYTPQLVVQMECAAAVNASLLVVRGGAEPIECPVFTDKPYVEAVWNAIDQFWSCCQTLTPPCDMQFSRIVPPEQWRSVDLDNDIEQPNWSRQMKELLEDWDDTESAAKQNTLCKEEIKKLLPDDVGLVAFGELQIKRMRNNAVWIRRK